jgi:hypothetical protein
MFLVSRLLRFPKIGSFARAGLTGSVKACPIVRICAAGAAGTTEIIGKDCQSRRRRIPIIAASPVRRPAK